MTTLNAEHPDVQHWQHRFLQSMFVALAPGDEDEKVRHDVVMLAATLAVAQFVDMVLSIAEEVEDADA